MADDPTPFIKFILSIIDMAYKDFEERLEIVHKKLNANELVELAFDKKIGKIKKSDIVELCPNLSVSAVEKGIANVVGKGKEKAGCMIFFFIPTIVVAGVWYFI